MSEKYLSQNEIAFIYSLPKMRILPDVVNISTAYLHCFSETQTITINANSSFTQEISKNLSSIRLTNIPNLLQGKIYTLNGSDASNNILSYDIIFSFDAEMYS